MTCAPRSPRIWLATGPARFWPTSTTLTPASGNNSIAFALVDQREERLAGLHALEVLHERRHDALAAPGRAARGVRRHDHAGMPPQRMLERQRLGIRDVEPGAPDQPIVERLDEIIAVHDRAARDVDQDRG